MGLPFPSNRSFAVEACVAQALLPLLGVPLREASTGKSAGATRVGHSHCTATGMIRSELKTYRAERGKQRLARIDLA